MQRKAVVLTGWDGGSKLIACLLSGGMLYQASAQVTLETSPEISARLYGKVKVDASYDEAAVDAGNYARWVLPEGTDGEQYNLTARATQLGLKLIGSTNASLSAAGRVEVDFYEGGAENKNRLQLRHAYVSLDNPAWRAGVLAGQTHDILSPLLPTMLNYTVGWWSGNIGYRRPQVRAYKDWGVPACADTWLTTVIGCSRTAAHNSSFDSQHEDEDNETPVGQGRIGLATKVLGRAVAVGVSGHTGEEEIALGPEEAPREQEFDTWSGNLDVSVTLSPKAKLQGEWWQGENLDHYLGGIGLGVNDTIGAEREVGAEGGWVALGVGPWGQWRFNLGAGMDDTDDADLKEGERSKNESVWVNAICQVIKYVDVGLELSQWETDYAAKPAADAMRVQASMIYTF